VHGGPAQSNGVFAKSLGQLSLAGRAVETAYMPLKGFRRNAVPPIVAARSNSSAAVARTPAEPTATGFGDQPPRSLSTLL